MGKRHVPIPRQQGSAPLLELRPRRQTGSADTELDSRPFLRGLIEAEADLRAIKSEVFQFPAIEMAQHRQRGVTLATRDRGRHQAIDKPARARQKNRGSAPCNWRGGGGQNVFKNSHSAIFQVAGATSCSCQCCGNSLNLPDTASEDFQRAVIYRPDWLEIGRPKAAGAVSAHGDIFTDP